MALDVAEFLWCKFVSSLQEAESELSGSIFISVFKSIKNLISYFKSIKDVVKEIDIMPEGYSYSETIRLLYDLNDALAECRIFAHECNELNKKLLLFNPFTHYFIQRMKTRLARIKLELEKMGTPEEEEEEISSPPEKAEDTVSAQVFGFDEQSKEIEDLLVGGGFGFRAIGVVGIAGVGKTTLVQKVLQRETVKEKFSPIIWVPFSGMKGEQQFSRFSFETCVLGERIVGLDKLMERLDPLLSGKKYLVVLDDVCRRHINIQDRLWRRLPKGSGGAVIVTSRLMEVAQKLDLVVVDPLDREVCWRIFEETLKNNEGNLNMSQSKTLKSIENEIKDQCQGLPLAAKTLASIVPEQIRELESNRFLMEMYIPDELLMPDLDAEPVIYTPTCPVLVFIDMKNEKLGRSLFDVFCYRLNTKQVYSVLEDNSDSKLKVEAKNPEMVLKEVYGNLEKHKQKGYGFASEIQKGMRIVIVGGDAVVNWILRVICDLKLPEAPSIVPIPQGAENDILVSFGWKQFSADHQSVKLFLDQVLNAEKMKTDSWHILIKLKSTESSTEEQEIPHSLHLFRPVAEGPMQNTDNPVRVSELHGGFWNYFSLGVDASSWYGANCFRPTARTLNSLAKVLVKKDGQWEPLNIRSSIKSIICLNLPSFCGELDLWDTENMKKNREEAFTDDGLLEIIGQKDVWLAQKERICLDQVRGIRFEFIEGAAEFVNMSFDGTPWKKIPLARIMDIEMSYHSQVNILANGVCPAKRRNHDSSQPSTSVRNEDNNVPCASRTDDDNNAPSASRSDYENNAAGASITDDGNAKDKSKKPKFGGTKTFQKRTM